MIQPESLDNNTRKIVDMHGKSFLWCHAGHPKRSFFPCDFCRVIIERACKQAGQRVVILVE